MHTITKYKKKIVAIWQWFLVKPWRFAFILVGILIITKIFGGNGDEFEEILVEQRDLKRTVLASGEVVSTVDLDLSFSKSGVVEDIKVNVGDVVEKGQILANIKQGTLSASVTQARGALLSAQAKYQQVLEGATSEEISLAEINLQTAKDNLAQTKLEQETAVLNARRTLYSDGLEAVSEDNEDSNIDVYITGVFNSEKVGTYILEKSNVSPDWKLIGPQSFSGSVSSVTPEPIGDTGLFIRFSTESLPYGYAWKVEIPNTAGANYATNKAVYDAALANYNLEIASAENNVKQKEAELAIKRQIARPSEISAAEANVLEARGKLEAAEAELKETLLVAPENGTVTAINIKKGELSESQNVAMVIENTESLYVESNVNESNIDLVYKDAMVEIDFDAFPDKKYIGKISFVEPSETLVDGVVNYKVKANILDIDENVRPGLTANLVINIWKIEGAKTLPSRVIYERDGKNYVLVKNGRKEMEVEIEKGRIGDGAIAEISGILNPGDIVLVRKEI